MGENITVHLERPNQNGFDIAEYVLPVCYCKKCIGFNEDEEYKLRQFVEKNIPLSAFRVTEQLTLKF